MGLSREIRRRRIIRVNIYADGASKGNPGRAAIGAVIVDEEGETLLEISQSIGVTTNNVAEYTAVKEALKAAKSLGAEEVVLYLDSELVVKQLNGEYRVRSPGLTSLYEEVIGLASTFLSFSVQHVGRDKNKRADRLANLALARGG